MHTNKELRESLLWFVNEYSENGIPKADHVDHLNYLYKSIIGQDIKSALLKRMCEVTGQSTENFVTAVRKMITSISSEAEEQYCSRLTSFRDLDISKDAGHRYTRPTIMSLPTNSREDTVVSAVNHESIMQDLLTIMLVITNGDFIDE